MTCVYLLRRARPSDIEPLHELFCIPEVYRFLTDGSPPPLRVAKNWAKSSRTDSSELGIGVWTLVRSTDPGIVGAVRLARLDEDCLVELTYLLHPKVWGQGLATRMAHTAMLQAFANPRIKGVWAGTDLPNSKSIDVMRRIGMSFRRHVTYPLGPGVEYVCFKEHFEPERNTPLALATDEKV